MSAPEEINQIFDMPTANGARILRLEKYGTKPGCQADLVVLNAPSPLEAITLQADCRYVFKRGRLIAETEKRSKMHWLPEIS